MMLRSVTAQCFRRGKSLGEALIPYGTGIAFGTGLGAFLCRIYGFDTSRDAEEIEKSWKTDQRELEYMESILEKLKWVAEIKNELKRLRMADKDEPTSA